MITKHLLVWDRLTPEANLDLMKVPFFGSMHKTGDCMQLIVVGAPEVVAQQVEALQAAAGPATKSHPLDSQGEPKFFEAMQADETCQARVAELDLRLPATGTQLNGMLRGALLKQIKKQNPVVTIPVAIPPVPIAAPAPKAPGLLRRLYDKVWG